jgi:type IV secretory pathway TraG/TraD family ATPase VirD4
MVCIGRAGQPATSAQLHTAITENRKSKNPLVLGFQGKAQLEVIYGHLAEVMLSQPATKIF